MTTSYLIFNILLQSISCYDDVIFNFYYFIAVSIANTCSMSLMRFSNRIFLFIFLFYFIADLKQVETVF